MVLCRKNVCRILSHYQLTKHINVVNNAQEVVSNEHDAVFILQIDDRSLQFIVSNISMFGQSLSFYD